MSYRFNADSTTTDPDREPPTSIPFPQEEAARWRSRYTIVPDSDDLWTNDQLIDAVEGIGRKMNELARALDCRSAGPDGDPPRAA